MKLNKTLLMKKITQHAQVDIDHANALVAQDHAYRPTFHIAPPNGLMNDPNGLIFIDNQHYIHYQWSPLQPFHGLKHWRLVKTTDFINYQDLGVSIIPDHIKESHGAFSGSAYPTPDGIKIYYTGNIEDKHGNMVEEVQLKADFVNDKIVNKRVVVEHDAQLFTPHTRDPKIFEYQNKIFLIFGAQSQANQQGELVFYQTNDYEHFSFYQILQPSIPNQTYGYMWECPNLDLLDGQILFIQSAEGYHNNDDQYELNNSRNVVYTKINAFDFNKHQLGEAFVMRSMDAGHDFYAPQTYWCENKLLVIGWFGNVDVQYPTDVYSWHSMLTIPRELSWRGDVLVQHPFTTFKSNVFPKANAQLLNVQELMLDDRALLLVFELEQTLSITIINESGESIKLSFTIDEIILDRSKQTSAPDWAFEGLRRAKRTYQNQIVEIYIDHSALEIFANNYETVFTSRFFVKDFNKITFSQNLKYTVTYAKPIHYTS